MRSRREAPDLLGDLLYVDVLAGEHVTEIDLAASQTDPATARHGDRPIVKWVPQQSFENAMPSEIKSGSNVLGCRR